MKNEWIVGREPLAKKAGESAQPDAAGSEKSNEAWVRKQAAVWLLEQ